jgi:hypothetical protein
VLGAEEADGVEGRGVRLEVGILDDVGREMVEAGLGKGVVDLHDPVGSGTAAA